MVSHVSFSSVCYIISKHHLQGASHQPKCTLLARDGEKAQVKAIHSLITNLSCTTPSQFTYYIRTTYYVSYRTIVKTQKLSLYSNRQFTLHLNQLSINYPLSRIRVAEKYQSQNTRLSYDRTGKSMANGTIASTSTYTRRLRMTPGNLPTFLLLSDQVAC